MSSPGPGKEDGKFFRVPTKVKKKWDMKTTNVRLGCNETAKVLELQGFGESESTEKRGPLDKKEIRNASQSGDTKSNARQNSLQRTRGSPAQVPWHELAS